MSTNEFTIRLPLHTRNDRLALVLAKLMGEPFALTVSQSDGAWREFDLEIPSGPHNPWQVLFERRLELDPRPFQGKRMDHATFVLRDRTGEEHTWLYFPDSERAKTLLLEGALALAVGRRLVDFFGGSLCDAVSEETIHRVAFDKALYPQVRALQTDTDRWHQFQNVLRDFPELRAQELEAAMAETCEWITARPLAQALAARERADQLETVTPVMGARAPLRRI